VSDEPRIEDERDAVGPGEDGSAVEGVASPRVLRRIGILAAALGTVAGVAYGARSGGSRGLALTGSAVVSIVALRSLEGVVRRLRMVADEAPGALGGTDPREDSLGWRYPVRVLLLLVLLVAIARLGRDPLAIVLGVSAVPVAILVEALLQLFGLVHDR